MWIFFMISYGNTIFFAISLVLCKSIGFISPNSDFFSFFCQKLLHLCEASDYNLKKMIRSYLVAFLLISFPLLIFSQVEDSVEKALRNASEKEKIGILNKLPANMELSQAKRLEYALEELRTAMIKGDKKNSRAFLFRCRFSL